MRGKYNWILEKVFASEKKKYNEEESLTLAVIGCYYKCVGDEEKVRDYLEKYTSRMEHEFTLYPILRLKKQNVMELPFV